MLITLSNGNSLRGDLVKSIVVRYDLSPVPASIEAEIRIDNEIERLLSDGEMLFVNGDQYRIVKTSTFTQNMEQGGHKIKGMKITALLNACVEAGFIRSRAIIKESATLLSIYRAAGCKVNSVVNDFSLPRFSCFVGETPSFHISNALQENGGIVYWKNGAINFSLLGDLFKQDPVLIIQDYSSDHIDSEFLERYEVPFFLSLDDAGQFVVGDNKKPRVVTYSPFKSQNEVNKMSQCLIHKKDFKTNLTPKISAGDCIEVIGIGKMIIVTAAHVFESGTDGSSSNQYTKLWLSSMRKL